MHQSMKISNLGEIEILHLEELVSMKSEPQSAYERLFIDVSFE
jgi:hypothetical protein